ncbi:hypothetical protein JCM5350_007099 [Sporobolomyces pararoseus]
MSISSLPVELHELIVSFIHDKTSRPTAASQKTFASLARTSKLFLPLACCHLYYRPIAPVWPNVTWKRALSLVSSLSTRLGELVVSLEGIVDFVTRIGNLEEPSASLPFQLRGFTKAFSLYYKLLLCCLQLKFVEIVCDSKKHLTKLLEALKNSLLTLKTVKFANSPYSSAYYITGDIIYQALFRLGPGNVDEVILFYVDVSDLSGDPHGPLALRSFSVHDPHNTFSHYKSLLPQDSSSLSSISLENTRLSDSDLTWILSYLPSTIRSLKLNATFRLGASPIGTLQHYLQLARTSLPPSRFARFTCLDQVSLKGFDGPSLMLLHTLVTSSPDIRLLDFSNSRWVDPSSSTSTSFDIVDGSIPSLLDSDALLSHLLRFEKLESVYLGILPTKKQTFEILEKEMEEKRGVEVGWQMCS